MFHVKPQQQSQRVEPVPSRQRKSPLRLKNLPQLQNPQQSQQEKPQQSRYLPQLQSLAKNLLQLQA
jgi:hypothetical protein